MRRHPQLLHLCHLRPVAAIAARCWHHHASLSHEPRGHSHCRARPALRVNELNRKSKTGTDFRDLKSSQGPARTARSAKPWIGTFFWKASWRTLRARRPFLRPPSMSDSAGNCTVMIVDPVRCQGRQKTGVSTTFLTHHTALYAHPPLRQTFTPMQ